MLTALCIIGLVIALAFVVWAACWCFSDGGIFSFFIGMDLIRVAGYVLGVLLQVIAGALSDS